MSGFSMSGPEPHGPEGSGHHFIVCVKVLGDAARLSSAFST